MLRGHFRKIIRVVSSAVLTTLFVTTSVAYASSFKVNPLTFTLDQNTKAAVLKLTNTSDHDLTVQLESKRWTQDKNGTDVYDDTPDIIFFPKIVKIQKNEERIVRIGFRGQLPVKEEVSYRLFAQELPSQGGNATFKFAFRFSMPIFVLPKIKTIGKEKMLKASVYDSELHLVLTNTGTAHVVVNKIGVIGLDGMSKEVFNQEGAGWYILPNITRDFKINLDEAQCRQIVSLNVEATTKIRTFKLNVPVKPAQCVAKKKPQQSTQAPNRKIPK